MKTLMRWSSVAVCVFALALCASAQSGRVLPGLDKALAKVSIRHMDRTVLGEDVVHYRFDVVVGPGKFDVIRLHRVVREKSPYQPIHTVGGVLLLPGSPNFFEAIFMAPLFSQATAWDHSIAIFLAENKVDVWGMDYSWALVPAEQTNFKFMKDWGVERDSHHAEIALSLARAIRAATDQGFGQIELLGFSYGGIVTYALAGQETQQPRVLRNVKGMIILDVAMKLKEKAYRSYYCGLAATDQANLDAGVYSDDSGLFLKSLSDLALSAPDRSVGKHSGYHELSGCPDVRHQHRTHQRAVLALRRRICGRERDSQRPALHRCSTLVGSARKHPAPPAHEKRFRYRCAVLRQHPSAIRRPSWRDHRSHPFRWRSGRIRKDRVLLDHVDGEHRHHEIHNAAPTR